MKTLLCVFYSGAWVSALVFCCFFGVLLNFLMMKGSNAKWDKQSLLCWSPCPDHDNGCWERRESLPERKKKLPEWRGICRCLEVLVQTPRRTHCRELFAAPSWALDKLHPMGDAEALQCQVLARKRMVSGNAGVKRIHVASMLGRRRERREFLI